MWLVAPLLLLAACVQGALPSPASPHTARAPVAPDYSALEFALTPATFYALDPNETKEYRHERGEPATRRQLASVAASVQSMHSMYYFRQHNKQWDINKICFMIQGTLRPALLELRKYYNIRPLYSGYLEYEIGYVTHEIVARYTIMLELYYVIVDRHKRHEKAMKNKKDYYENYVEKGNVNPLSYVFYMYTVILEQSKVVVHLCNMLHEIEEKYHEQKREEDEADEDALENLDPQELYREQQAQLQLTGTTKMTHNAQVVANRTREKVDEIKNYFVEMEQRKKQMIKDQKKYRKERIKVVPSSESESSSGSESESKSEPNSEESENEIDGENVADTGGKKSDKKNKTDKKKKENTGTKKPVSKKKKGGKKTSNQDKVSDKKIGKEDTDDKKSSKNKKSKKDKKPKSRLWPTTPRMFSPVADPFPLEYGWSIEDW